MTQYMELYSIIVANRRKPERGQWMGARWFSLLSTVFLCHLQAQKEWAFFSGNQTVLSCRKEEHLVNLCLASRQIRELLLLNCFWLKPTFVLVAYFRMTYSSILSLDDNLIIYFINLLFMSFWKIGFDALENNLKFF